MTKGKKGKANKRKNSTEPTVEEGSPATKSGSAQTQEVEVPVPEDMETSSIPNDNDVAGTDTPLNAFPTEDLEVFKIIRDMGNKNPGSAKIDMKLEGAELWSYAVKQRKDTNTTFEVRFGLEDGYPKVARMAKATTNTKTTAKVDEKIQTVVIGRRKQESFTDSTKVRTGTGHYVIKDFNYKFFSNGTSRDILIPTDQFDSHKYQIKKTESDCERPNLQVSLKFSIQGKQMAVVFFLPSNVLPSQVLYFQPARGTSGIVKFSLPCQSQS